MTEEVNPEIVFALRKFDLITDEQLEVAYAEWEKANDNWQWLYFMSGLAWKNLPARKRAFTDFLKWRFAWMDSWNDESDLSAP